MKDKLLDLIKRRHPEYEERVDHWDFLEETYEGGRCWFENNIFRYLREGETEYKDRVKRAYRFNHTKQVVDLVDKYLFKMPIARREEDVPESVQRFWKNCTLTGLNIDTFSRRISNATSRYGRIWIVVDSSFKADEGVLTLADRERLGGAPYAYIVRPQDMLDMSYDEQGELIWALVREIGRDDADPFESSGNEVLKYRLWTRESWFLFREIEQRGKTKVVLEAQGDHNLSLVPIVQADHSYSEETYESSGLIDDIAYLDRANANYLSNLDAIIQDQTFSQLTMPAQGLLPGEEGHTRLVEMGTKRIFTYNGEAGQKPEYISPDPRQAGMILSAIGKIVNEIYHSVGLSAERTKEDNGGGIDNSSGVAKAYDFERTNALLQAKAQSLQIAEIRIARLVALWEGDSTSDVPDGAVVYPEKFDTRSLYDEFEIAARLSLLAAPEKVRQMQMSQLVDKMFPGASESERKELAKSIEDWPPEPPELATGLGDKSSTDGSDGSDAIKAASTQKTAKELTA